MALFALAQGLGEPNHRSIFGESGDKAFCVYDQTVPRNVEGAEPVPTYAGVFQRDIKCDVEGAESTIEISPYWDTSPSWPSELRSLNFGIIFT